jgi:hypothetical protein
MKKIIFTLLFIAPLLLQAQNFSNICSSGTTFFKKMNTTSVKAYKSTSFIVPSTGDTVFYTYSTIRDTAAECKDTTKGSILGRKIYRRSSQMMYYFFNKRNDTIFVSYKELVNNTWKFVNLTMGTYLEATVASIAPDSVMGLLDDVMTITFQAKRNDGQLIASPWNGKFIKLSKHYGLSKTFDMVNIPFDTTHYTVVGKLKPVIGIQEFGWKEVYNFAIGDVLHYSGYTNSYTSGANTTYKEIQKVYSKTSYGANNDSVVYKFDRCRSTVSNPGNNHVYTHDTLTVKYKFNVMANDSTIMRLPDQFKRENVYASQYDRFMKAFNNRQTKKIFSDKYRFINSCFVIPTGSITVTRNYSEGLGQTEYFRDDQSSGQEFNRLVYFKKGSETWGNAVGTDCSPILDVTEQQVTVNQQVRIVPNPMKNQAEILIDGIKINEDLQFVLYNIVGKEVYRQDVTSNSMMLERKNLPTGLYLYILKGKEIVAKGKLIVE